MVLSVTGGGSRAISALLEVPGASRTVLEAVVPYAAPALIAWLRAKPEHFCEPRTARAMAMVGFQRALEYAAAETSTEASPAAGPPSVAGIGCTASLASDRPKHGPHRAHVAAQTTDMTLTHSLELTKGRRSRFEEERLVATLLLNTVAEVGGLDERLPLELLPGERAETTQTIAPPAWQKLLLGQAEAVRAGGESAGVGLASSSHPTLILPPTLIFPGAFNPLHEGHREMAAVAGRRLGRPVEFEISIVNVDKPPLDYTEMQHRAVQFEPGQTLWFTRAPTFVQKSSIFPGETFVVGADTITRIADPCYYHDDAATCQTALAQIAENGCRFLVFGRRTDSGFQSLSDLKLPEALLRICDEVPAADFRRDISSTELRRAEKG